MDAKARLDNLMKKRTQLDARLSTMRAQLSRQERRDEARRKIIAGAWAYDFLGGDWKLVGERLRNAGMLRERDAPLFGLGENRSVRQSDAEPPSVPLSGTD